MTRLSCHHALLALLLLASAALLIGAAYQAGASRHVSAQTVYLPDAIESFHTITIVGDLGAKASLTLDPNTCTLNQFGDLEACTLLPPSTRQVMLNKLDKADPAGRGRVLYSIDGAGLGKPLFLVVPADDSQPMRLVYGDRGPGTPRPIALEPTVPVGQPPSKAAAVEPCTARYLAWQVPGLVAIAATGVHPTAGYEVFFEQSPLAVFPPQFRLLHVKPAGPVAQVITPFSAITTISTQQKIDRVVVSDASGSHGVPVEQASLP